MYIYYTIYVYMYICIYTIKKYSSFDRCNLPVWGQDDQATSRDNRSEIMTITFILIGHISCRSWQSFSINQLYEKNSFIKLFFN